MTSRRWNSVGEVIAHFRLTSGMHDSEGIIAELKAKRVNMHPDKSGGDFSTDADSETYHQLDDAITFMTEQARIGDALVPFQQIEDLVKTAIETALAPIRESDSTSAQSQFQRDFRIRIAARYKLPRFTSAVFGAIFLGTMALSDKLKDNPILTPLMRMKFLPYVIWALLLVCGSSFLVTWVRERSEKNLADELTSDRGLQRAFRSFCAYPLSEKMREKNLATLHFCKLEYADSLEERIEGLSDIVRHLRGMIRARKRANTASKSGEFSDWRTYHRQRILEIIRTFPGRTSLGPVLGERLADIHLRRLVDRRVIRHARTSDLDECYEIDREGLERITDRTN